MWFHTAFVVVLTLTVSTRSDTGSCPPTLSVDVCEAVCGSTTPCEGPKLCCPTVCGGSMCVDPMTKRHFTALVKPGRCPENPRGVWVCSHMCTGDSDCPRALKCCPNRCGALACQKPDPEPLPTETTEDAPDIDARASVVPNA